MWSDTLKVEHTGDREAALRRCALTVQLLSHVDHDSTVAAPTTSLPERIGGDRNYDYRYAWVRDASLSLALLARMGKTHEVGCYLDWLCGLPSTTDAPLQVCYSLDGDLHLDQNEVGGIQGYRDSLPVLKGNHAAKQMQLGSLGFFAERARIYLDHGGEWKEEHWQLLERMMPRNRGHIIQVGSALAYRGIPLQSAYCASKHAIQRFMDTFQAELIHQKSDIIACMVQMPALNTPQFAWCLNKMPRHPQPVPPIYQPEVAAQAIVFASKNKRREIYVGLPTVIAIVGNKLFPRVGDWYLGKSGVSGQMTREKARPDKPTNLYEPVSGDKGAHGRFDDKACKFSPQLWTDLHRNWIVGTVLAVLAVVVGSFVAGDQGTRR